MGDIASSKLVLSFAEAQSTSRWYYEKQRLEYFPSFHLLGSNGNIAAAQGTLDTQYGNTYAIRVDLLHYPFSLPSVRPKDWTIHPSAPHKFSSGEICIMRSVQWRTYFTVALVVAKTAIWLAKYELWKRNGHVWPGLGQSH